MNVDSVICRPAREIAHLVGRRELSPIEVVQAHLARIDALNPSLNAFVHVGRDGALAAANRQEAMLRRGVSPGPLQGVPVSIKSAIAVEGMPWETGSAFRAGIRADRDAILRDVCHWGTCPSLHPN